MGRTVAMTQASAKGCGPLRLGGAIFDRWRSHLTGPLGPTPRPSSDPKDKEIERTINLWEMHKYQIQKKNHKRIKKEKQKVHTLSHLSEFDVACNQISTTTQPPPQFWRGEHTEGHPV